MEIIGSVEIEEDEDEDGVLLVVVEGAGVVITGPASEAWIDEA